jgi:excisionase family DNA binding protein
VNVLRLLSDELVAEIERLVDERIDAAIRAASAEIDASPWLSLRDCAVRLRVSERTVSRLVKRGRIRTCSVGRRVLVHAGDLDAAVRGDARRPTPQ